MSKKRFKLIYNEYQTSNGKTIKAEPYFIDTKEEYVDEVYFTIKGYPTMSDEQVVDLLNENEQLKQFKELLCAVLKQEYEDRTNEMDRWAEKEDWNGYRATKLEYGTVIRIAKRIGVDLDD